MDSDICEEYGCSCGECECYSCGISDIESCTDYDKKVYTTITEHITNSIFDWEDILGPKKILSDIIKFYLLLEIDDPVLTPSFAKKLATRLVNYMLISSMGEARHCVNEASGSITSLGPFAKGITMAVNEDQQKFVLSRDTMWEIGYILANKFKPIKVFEALTEIFENLEWGGAYGGNAWANLTRFAIKYLNKEFSDIIFVDGCMNIVHNGGWAFDKYYYSGNLGFNLNNFLVFKRQTNNMFEILKTYAISDVDEVGRLIKKIAKERFITDVE
jgi:hypothetical protein